MLVIARRAGSHELYDRGAALTYYSVLSLIPGLLVLCSILGLVGTSDTVDHVLSVIKDVGPSSSDVVAKDQLESLVRHQAESGALLGVGIVAVLWTASAYVGSFFRASASVWGVDRRAVWWAWPTRLLLTVAFLFLVALVFLLLTLTGELAKSTGDALGIQSSAIDLYAFLKWPLLLVVVTLLVALLYRASPSGKRSATRWRVLTPGGAAAVAAWILVSVAFELYANYFATYNDTYGALGTTVAGLVWLWLTNLTLLMGVELDAALEFRSVADVRRRPPPAGPPLQS
jgi:membrane protein